MRETIREDRIAVLKERIDQIRGDEPDLLWRWASWYLIDRPEEQPTLEQARAALDEYELDPRSVHVIGSRERLVAWLQDACIPLADRIDSIRSGCPCTPLTATLLEMAASAQRGEPLEQTQTKIDVLMSAYSELGECLECGFVGGHVPGCSIESP